MPLHLIHLYSKISNIPELFHSLPGQTQIIFLTLQHLSYGKSRSCLHMLGFAKCLTHILI